MMDGRNSTCLSDDEFGPAVVGCRQNFDFTNVFEQSMLSIVPSSWFLILAGIRLAQLYKKPVVLKGRSFQVLKLVTASLYLLLQISFLAVQAGAGRNQQTEVAAASLSLCAALLVVALSFFEHTRSLRPSALLNAYLFVSLLLDATQARTRWLSDPHSLSTRVFTASTGLKVALLTLEAWEKSRWVPSRELYSPESTSGIFNRGFLCWLNDLVVQGYRKTLSLGDLYVLDESLSADRHLDLFWNQWKNTLRRSSGWPPNRPLIVSITKTLPGSLLAPVLPRILVGCFSFCQPFFINAVLEYLQADVETVPRSHGYGLIGAAGLIYTGLAICSCLYWQLHQRALAKVRACLLTTIYRKTLRQRYGSEAGSSAITLMNSDILRIQSGLSEMHEFWACIIETAVAAWLLQRQLGTAFMAPIVVVLVCTALTFAVAKFAGRRQAEWMSRQQKRIGLTSSIIPNLLAIKMSGLEYQVGHLVQQAREAEISGAKRFRVLTSTTAALAYAPLLLSPAFAFAVSGSDLTISRAFTSLAWIHMLCNGLPHVLQSVPQMLAALTSFGRIEEFLASEETERLDFRKPAAVGEGDGDVSMVTVQGGQFGWKANEWVVEDADITIPRGKITMIAGPVASGKSTLCKALLGEVSFHQGQVLLHPDARQAAYCEQDPFLINGTIRENIISYSQFNGPWYERVVSACHLTEDFAAMPRGDQSIVGSKGLALSGGQKKRVALARALHARPKFVILDDVLSGLDSHTEHNIARDVFGPMGLVREIGATVVLVTSSTRHYNMADHLVTLAGGTVVSSGSPSSLELPTTTDGDEGSGKNPQESQAESDEAQFTARPAHEATQLQPTEARKFGGIEEHKFYLHSIGFGALVPYAFLSITFAFLFNFGHVWLQFWARSNENKEDRTPFYLGIYFLVGTLCASLMGIFAWYGGCVMAPRASSKLHLNALRTLLRAPLKYLTGVDASVPTGYFAQDMGIIDFTLALSLDNTVLTGLTTLGQAVVIGVASPWVLVGYPVLGFVLFVVQKIYLRTSTQLRFLILEAKDPLYKHFMETLAGLPTIRAFDRTASSTVVANAFIDQSQRPSYLLAMLTQWLNIILNMCVAAAAVVFVALATQVRTSAGFTGVGLVSLMSFAEMLSNLVRCYAELQTATAALSRLKSFEEVGSEAEGVVGAVEIPGDGWPGRGEVRIEGVSATYGDASDAKANSVLREVTLHVSAGEKILICGRTGSGKSSLLLLLQGLLGPATGSILIDDTPITTIFPPALRSRIISLPQTPFFLPDGHNLRQNLEYHGRDQGFTAESIPLPRQGQDAECEHALRTVGLWDTVQARGGLDAEMSEGSLSRGEKQLLSLARAVLRRTKSGGGCGVLLLDEANTGMDEGTEDKMWEVVGEEFLGYTVICVAHGLRGLRLFDRVVVLDRGEVVEVGVPAELLGREDGRFRDLWRRGDEGGNRVED